MNHLDIVMPFGLPPKELAADLVRELRAPSLALLASRSRTTSTHYDEQMRALLPHEAWLARQFGLADNPAAASLNSPHIAIASMQAIGMSSSEGYWFVLNPVHLHIARDHLVLTDQRRLLLSEDQSRTLFNVAQPLFEENGKTLVYGSASAWFVHADDWSGLRTCTPDAACGHNIDIWMPKGQGEREWRKLQNEVQMHWHGHRINEEREAQGMKTINSLWLWGGASGSAGRSPIVYDALLNTNEWTGAIGDATVLRMHAPSASEAIAATADRGLLYLDALIEPALSNDWSNWLDRMHQYDIDWFAPLHDALKAGRLGTVSLIATHHAKMTTFNISRLSLRKFWVKPSLMPLCS